VSHRCILLNDVSTIEAEDLGTSICMSRGPRKEKKENITAKTASTTTTAVFPNVQLAATGLSSNEWKSNSKRDKHREIRGNMVGEGFGSKNLSGMGLMNKNKRNTSLTMWNKIIE
jgi:hypothetical protein